jgi:hypothetical protein
MKFQETIDKTRSAYIWTEGLDKLNESLKITAELAAKAELPRLQRRVEGGAVCVPAYISGHPKAMYRKDKAPAVDRPVLSVGINTGIAWVVNPEQRLNFAAAMLAAVDELESSGYRCELIALWRAASDKNDDYSKWANIEVMLKRPQDRWNPSSVAFCVAHPAVQRHMYWKILETQEEWRQCTDGYCYHKDSIAYDRSMSADFDIYFGNMCSNIASKCNTPEGAFEYVQSIINDQMSQMEAV